MSSRDRSRRRVLSQDERVLWSTVTRLIKPMRAGTPAAPAPADKVEAEPAPPARAVRQAAAPPEPSEPASPPELAPLGRRLRARVARGKEAIDARLDLHGLTQAQAHAALLQFLRNASARDARMVLVITGKGSRDLGSSTFGRRGDGERGVLKRQVPQWLGLPEFRSFVVGFEDANVAHGGAGALYVRIRRSKSR